MTTQNRLEKDNSNGDDPKGSVEGRSRIVKDRQAIQKELLAIGAWQLFENTDLPIGFLPIPDRLHIFYQQKGCERAEQNFLVWLQYETVEDFERALVELQRRMVSATHVESVAIQRMA